MNRHLPPDDFDRPDIATFVGRGAPDFRKAKRHSARVRLVKRVLPVAILVAVVLMITVPLVRNLSMKVELPFDLGTLSLSGTRLTMEAPKLSGFTDDNRAYNISAGSAIQDVTKPDLIGLTDITARLELANKGWATVKSHTGSLDTKTQFITLSDGVDLATNGGYAGKMQDAAVDVKAGSVTTDHPVVLTYLDGKLVSDRLKITDRGSRAYFEGNVQLDFRLSSLPKSDPPAPAPQPIVKP
ncbi:membrane protein [Azorhizobium oxalatiphilum]|uniref:Membrane protein n=1 Tax=Azorhizobium oxalatiphilum TaxID=980631 RepID=A0A917BJ41_9HYPH|nr:LPS export ABC transporter periplasmic protein LptC [Azorhizobium oxalatiphilum]GGF46195.1 membrane protein [Azorhizobium oxalatiphilum]